MRNVGVIKIIKSYKSVLTRAFHRLTLSNCRQQLCPIKFEFQKRGLWIAWEKKKHLLRKNIPDWRVLLCSIENFQPSLDPTYPLGLQRVIWLVNANHQIWALFSLVSIFKKWLKEKVVASRLGFFIMIGPSRSTNGQMIIIWKISESGKLFVVRLKSRLVV